jgi:hypothetical protein
MKTIFILLFSVFFSFNIRCQNTVQPVTGDSLEIPVPITEIKKDLIKRRTEKEFTFNPVKDRNINNMVIMEIRNLGHKEFKVLIYYGRDEENLGGTVLSINASEKIENYSINVGKFKSWLTNENNWISILPLSGDIEVYSIRIIQGN